MKRKILSLLLAVTMLASLCLSGCGSDSGETKTQKDTENLSATEKQTEVAQDSNEELEEKTIQLWLYGPGKQKDSDEVWEAFNEMLQEYVPNTTVEFTVLTFSEYKEKYSQMLASGEPVDLAWVANWVTGDISQDAADGNLMPLDSLLDEYGQGIKEELGETVLDMHREKDGNLYYTISWQGLFSEKRAFYVPTELAELAGDTWVEDTQEIVTKWWNSDFSLENYQAVFDQFDILLSACKEADKLYSGVGVNSFMGWCYSKNIYTNVSSNSSAGNHEVGLLRGDDSFTVVDSIQSDSYRLYAQNMADYYQKGYIRSDIASLDVADESSYYFVKNGVYDNNTYIVGSHNSWTEDTAQQMTGKCGVEISVINIDNEGTLVKGDATAMAIPYCADEPERAMMVLNAIYTVPELYQLLIYGFEGVHYTDNGDGTITTPYGSQGTADDAYGLMKWTIGTCENSLVTQADTVGYYDKLREAEKTAYVNPFTGFTFDETPVQDIAAALSAVDDEYQDVIKKGYMGDKWEETLDKWIEERKAAGVDALIEEYQRQVDEYVAENNITSW